MINKFKKIVIKIGSNSIVDSKTKKIKSKWLDKLCKDLVKLNKTKKIIIVCSGAIALGSKSITNSVLRKLEDKQAAASVGQIELAYQWRTKLKKFKINVSQILLTLEDSEVRRRYLNARNTISSLHNKVMLMVCMKIIQKKCKMQKKYLKFIKLIIKLQNLLKAKLLILVVEE